MRKGSFDVAPVPHKKVRMTGLAAHYVVMSYTSKKKDAAWDFIKFLVSKESQILTSEYGNNIPAMKSVAESDKFLKNKNTPDINNRVFLNELDHASEWFFEECAYINPSFIQKNFDITRDMIAYGLLTPLQALKEHDEKMNRTIAEEKQKKIPRQFLGSGLFFICLLIILTTIIGLSKRKKNNNSFVQ
jgi:ABC-type glycerol-3-phosphate transport system substrate-binding protein